MCHVVSDNPCVSRRTLQGPDVFGKAPSRCSPDDPVMACSITRAGNASSWKKKKAPCKTQPSNVEHAPNDDPEKKKARPSMSETRKRDDQRRRDEPTTRITIGPQQLAGDGSSLDNRTSRRGLEMNKAHQGTGTCRICFFPAPQTAILDMAIGTVSHGYIKLRTDTLVSMMMVDTDGKDVSRNTEAFIARCAACKS